MPFFDEHGRIELKTTGAYGVVRHPIYAAGSGIQLGAFLVTGYQAVFVAWAVFTLGALWFTRQAAKGLSSTAARLDLAIVNAARFLRESSSAQLGR